MTLLLGALIASAGCHSAPKKPVEPEVVPVHKEVELQRELVRHLDRVYGRWQDPAAERILNSMISQIIEANPEYGELRANARVHLLETMTPYVAPGFNEVLIVSRGALALVSYENELAFVLSTQLALLKEHATAKNLANLQGEQIGEAVVRLPTAPPIAQRDYLAGGWFEAGGLFDLGPLVYLKAEAKGIQLAYGAKYDPRGAVTLIQRWTSQPVIRRFIEMNQIQPEPDERLTNAREEVAKLSPLRDPIVKSLAFEELKSRLHANDRKTKTAKKKKSPNK